MPLLNSLEIGSFYEQRPYEYPRSVRHQYRDGTHYFHLFEHLTISDIQHLEHGQISLDCVSSRGVAFLVARLLPDSLAVYLPLDPVIGHYGPSDSPEGHFLDLTGICARTGLVVARRHVQLDERYHRTFQDARKVYSGDLPSPDEFERRVRNAESGFQHKDMARVA